MVVEGFDIWLMVNTHTQNKCGAFVVAE